jgi:hypothetical protein
MDCCKDTIWGARLFWRKARPAGDINFAVSPALYLASRFP